MTRRFSLATSCLLALAACGPQGTADIQILTVSDWHGQLDPLSERDPANVTTTYGGIGLMKVYLDQARAANPNTVFVTAGDLMGATPALSSALEDRPAIAGMNFLGLDNTTLGNHDFDSGIDALRARMDEANFTYVTTNLTYARDELGAKPAIPYRIMELGEKSPKVKVAFLGITNPDAPSLLFPGRMESLQIQNPVDAATQAAKDARAAGAAVVVVLVHMGATGKDTSGNPTGPVIDFAQALTNVDVVVADHTDQIVNGTFGSALVVENRSKSRTYSKIQVSVVDGKVTGTSAEVVEPVGTRTNGTISCPATACPDSTWQCVSGRCVQTAQTPDPAAETLLQPYRAELATRFDVKATKTDGIFTRNGTDERRGEVPIGDLFTDALLDRYRSTDGAQIAFTNGGGIRASIPSSYVVQDTSLVRTNCSAGTPCDVVVGDIYTVLPFGNITVVRPVTGQLLWQVLEHSVAQYPNADGRFLQISGFTFEYSASAPAGSRVQTVTLLDAAGAPLKTIPRDDTTEYIAVTNDFTNAGGDGYTMLKEAVPSPTREVLADVLRDYVKAKALISPSQYPGGRIIRLP